MVYIIFFAGHII